MSNMHVLYKPIKITFEGDVCYLIPLTQGKFAVIDGMDLPLVEGFSWYARHTHNSWYATSSGTIHMHDVVLPHDPKLVVDHRNGDGLDNRRHNLRHATLSQNQQNRIHIGNGKKKTSRYRGVFWHNAARKWGAGFMLNQRNNYLGVFNDEIEAAKAYDAAVIEHFGEFARPNFPQECGH